MAWGKKVDYVDSEGALHAIQEYGRNEVTGATGGLLSGFLPEAVYIDGKRWAGFDDMGMGDPVEQAKSEIEDRIKGRAFPRP